MNSMKAKQTLLKVFVDFRNWSGGDICSIDDNGELCGCEALARWIDPVYGRLSPAEFIPVLEEYRLIHKLDKSIFESVCRDLREALDALEKGFNTCLAADAVTSRKTADRELALAAARAAGALVLNSEALLFMLLKDAKHPAFKAVSKLVR